MDGYPMPIADLLVDAAAEHRIISFMDGNAGYNELFMAEEDIPKNAFRCPGHVGLFERIVMTFGLKNAGATYQRAMNFIFHEFIASWWRFILMVCWLSLEISQSILPNYEKCWNVQGNMV